MPEYITLSRTVVLKTFLKGKSALFEFAQTLKQHNLLFNAAQMSTVIIQGFFYSLNYLIFLNLASQDT